MNVNLPLDWLRDVWFMGWATKSASVKTNTKISTVQRESKHDNAVIGRRQPSTGQKRKDKHIERFKLFLNRGINTLHKFLCMCNSLHARYMHSCNHAPIFWRPAFNRSGATRAIALDISNIHLIYPNLSLMEFQVRYLTLFLLFSVIDGFEWFWIGSLHKNIQLMLEFLKGPFWSYTFPIIH